MGKEGGYWGGRSLKRAEPETPSGCISSFFHFFDFHPFHCSFQQHQPLQASSNGDHTAATTTLPTGTEAPRNSLESKDSTMVVGSISKQENLEIPKNKLFIKTSTTGISRSNGGKVANIVNDLSPGTKTPTLVAKLMGLDLLPDTQQSPSSSSPSSSSTTTTTSSSCLSATKSRQVNPRQHNHHHHLRPRQHYIVITKPRHSMDDSIAASRFLPDTPRISSARRSDVEHRLSLQINKENMGVVDGENLEQPRFSFSKLKFEEQKHSSSSNDNKSPRHYAKQIARQMRENVLSSSRKVGSDVTNTVKNNRSEKQVGGGGGGGEFVVGRFMRSKKSPRTTPTCSLSDELSSPGKVSNNHPPSCSPRLRIMDHKNKLSTVTATLKDQISPKQVKFFDNQPQAKPKPQETILVRQQEAHQFQKQKSSVPKCKKAANEKFSARLKKQEKFVLNRQDESFVRPLLSSSDIKSSTGKSKRSHHHPLLINLLNLNTVQNLNSNNTPPAAKQVPQKQTQVCVAREAEKYCRSQLSSGSSQTYPKEATSSCILSTPTTAESNVELDKRKIMSGSMFNGPEFEYVSSIIGRTGFAVKKGTTTNTTVSVSLFHQWLYPTHQPLDSSIFHHLEQQFQNNQNQNQNQNPTSSIFSVSSQDRNLRPNKYDVGVRCNRRLLFDLVNETLLEVVGPCDIEEVVWERIRRFESNKKCEVLEDIDALIEMEDMGKMMKKMKSEEAMVAEIEGNIMDTLLHETVMMVTECCCCRR